MTGMICVLFKDARAREALVNHANDDSRYGETENHEIQFVLVDERDLHEYRNKRKKIIGVYSEEYIDDIDLQSELFESNETFIEDGHVRRSKAPKEFESLSVIFKLSKGKCFFSIAKDVEVMISLMSDSIKPDPNSFRDRHRGLV